MLQRIQHISKFALVHFRAGFKDFLLVLSSFIIMYVRTVWWALLLYHG